MTYLGEIQPTHVGRSFIRLNGKVIHIGDVIGPVQGIDIGKRVYVSDGVIQVENNEQRDKRRGDDV